MTASVSTPLQRGFALLVTLALTLASLVHIVVPAAARAATPTDLFFSEYIEGSSNNQALEIFNGTGAPVDVVSGDYSVRIVTEGAISEQLFALDGVASDVVADGDVFVVANVSASAAVQGAADQLVGGAWFNGDDAVVLLKGDTVLDVIGDVGSDPGDFYGSDPVTTLNQTLRRAPRVTQGDTNETDDFDPALEWTGHPENTFDGLGSHTIDAPVGETTVWINEIHYDNAGGDTGEAIEVAGPAGTDLSGWSLALYNGSNGELYDTISLSGVIPDQAGGFGTLAFPRAGIQNGSPDGIALVDGATVVQFLSYEGDFTADPGDNGPAAGLTSVDIGVDQPSSSPVGESLQLGGAGTVYEQFEWREGVPETFGAVNAGQVFGDATAVNCGGDLILLDGTTATRTVTAIDADDIVTDISIESPVPGITVGDTTVASGPGEEASAVVTVGADAPVGTHAVTVTASTGGADEPGSCTLDVRVLALLRVGDVQGQTLDAEDGTSDVSPLDGEPVFVQGVVTQRIRVPTSSGFQNYALFLQDSLDRADGDPVTSDGIVVFIGGSPFMDALDGGDDYFAEVGDEVVLFATVDEFFNLTELVSPQFVEEVEDGPTGADVAYLSGVVEIAEADPPDDLDEAHRYWERREGMFLSVPGGSVVTGARDVFASTFDGEVWVVRGDHELADREDPYARRVFRDPHPLDDVGPAGSFDNGNGMRILLLSHGLKWNESSNETLIAPARTFDTVTNELHGGVYFSFGKYGIEVAEQLELEPGVDPSLNAPPVPHDTAAEYATAPYNVENLYDFRDDPFDGCDFEDNEGCPGVDPPFNYVPASEADYEAHIGALADQILNDLHAPEILLIQEAEDQDICAVVEGALDCDDGVDDRDGKPDTLQELGLAIAALGGPMYDAAYDRDGADDRGIVSAFLYRTDRVELLPADGSHPVLGSAPEIEYAGAPLDYNADVSNPKALNAELPAGVPVGDSCDVPDVDCVFTRDPQVGHFRVWRDGIGMSTFTDLYAISNHFSSGPDDRVEQRTEQAAYNAAIVDALEETDDGARVVVGGDFNVFPEPDDPFPPPNESNQLAALYALGLHSLWEVVVAEVPESAYSYVFEGQAQTLDNQFVTDLLDEELNGVRFAHVNADWPAAFDGDGSRGASDHDPQVARFDALPTLERLDDLVDFYVESGQIDVPGIGEAIKSRLENVLDKLDTESGRAAERQLANLVAYLERHSPDHIDPAAVEALLDELELLLGG